jgi:hypothetical protein
VEPTEASGPETAEAGDFELVAVVLLELIRLTRDWGSHASRLVAFCLTAAAGIPLVVVDAGQYNALRRTAS